MPNELHNGYYISQVTLPTPTQQNANATTTYWIKDTEARKWIENVISGGLTFVIAWDGESTPVVANIPEGVTVTYGTPATTYTGTLEANASSKPNIYLVYERTVGSRKIYSEYVVVNFGTTETPIYGWEALGDTDISFASLGELAWKDTVTLNKGNGDVVLGEATTFTNSTSSVTFTGGTSDTFVKSYPGTTSKLKTATITGVGGSVTFNAVNANTSVTATNTVFGTDTTASKIETESKTATNTVFGTATKASKATAATAVTLAKAASSATNVSYLGSTTTTDPSVLESATVNNETLVIGAIHYKQSSVTGTNGTESITPYTFTDVTVPVVSSNTEVTVGSVKTNTDITVPVVSSNTEVTATNTTIVSKTAATSAANATTVATGSLDNTDTVGATVMTGLGNATTASAVTDIGTGTAAAQSITVGTNDKLTVAKYGDLSISVS